MADTRYIVPSVSDDIPPVSFNELEVEIRPHTKECGEDFRIRMLKDAARDAIREYAWIRRTERFERIPQWKDRDSYPFILPLPLEVGDDGTLPAERYDWKFGRITQMWLETGRNQGLLPEYYHENIVRLDGQLGEIPYSFARLEPLEEFYDLYAGATGGIASTTMADVNIPINRDIAVPGGYIVLPAGWEKYRTLVVGLTSGTTIQIAVSLLLGGDANIEREGATYGWNRGTFRLNNLNADTFATARLTTLMPGQLATSPEVAGGFCVEYCYTLGDKATQLPRLLSQEYGELIWRGALRRMPDKFLVDSRAVVEHNYRMREERTTVRQHGGVRMVRGLSVVESPYTGMGGN